MSAPPLPLKVVHVLVDAVLFDTGDGDVWVWIRAEGYHWRAVWTPGGEVWVGVSLAHFPAASPHLVPSDDVPRYDLLVDAEIVRQRRREPLLGWGPGVVEA